MDIPNWSFKFDPPLLALIVHGTNTKETHVFRFSDEQMSNHVAKAMVHAVELCGGGGKPEPF